MRLDDDRALSLLGLAHRAGAVERGSQAARAAVRRGEARLVLLAGDGAAKQVEKVVGLARNRAVAYGTLADRVSLGAAVGGPPLTAVAVTNGSFALELGRRLQPGGARTAKAELEQGPENGG